MKVKVQFLSVWLNERRLSSTPVKTGQADIGETCSFGSKIPEILECQVLPETYIRG